MPRLARLSRYFRQFVHALFSSEMSAKIGHSNFAGFTLQVLFFAPSYIASGRLGIFTCD
jgi:hypothetical protein